MSPFSPAAPEPSAVPVRPRVPLAPVLSAASLRRLPAREHPERLPSVLDAGAVRLVTSGRIALGLALREIGVGDGDTVLLPAYHSLSMIPPVLWRGAAPRFYRVDAHARADLADIGALCDDAQGAVKALVATHYFGFPQDLRALRALCDARGIALVEDCAHAFFGRHDGQPLGASGDYAIASTMKFYPTYEGGALVSNRRALDGITLHSAGLGFEAKAALATLEHGFAYGRLGLLRALLALPLSAKDWLWGRIKARHATPAATAPSPAAAPSSTGAPKLAPASSDSEAGFDPHWLDKRSSLFARLLLKRVPAERIVTLRRRHYARLQAATHGLPGCRPLHAALPDGVCPWLFPLVVDDAEGAFARIRALGMPVTRFAERLWPGVDETVCAHSAYLSRHVLAFPCHQEMNDAEFAWLEGSLAQVLAPSMATA